MWFQRSQETAIMPRKILFLTPDTRHLSDPEFGSVYNPAEDSFLFLDALVEEWGLIEGMRPALCLEIGCGSGVVSAFVAQNLDPDVPCAMLCVDINPHALRATRITFDSNAASAAVHLETLTGDLATSLLPAATGKCDLILFNPPYVVTSSEELQNGDLTTRAWAGGQNGREVIDRFLPQAAQLLSPTGVMYCVALKENDVEDITKTVAHLGLSTECVLARRCQNERLHVLRFIHYG